MRKILEFIMAGRPQAVGVILILTLLGLFIPFFWLLSGAIIALITLRMGLVQALWVIGWSAVLLSIFSLGLFGTSSRLGLVGTFAASAGFGLAQWLPVAVFAWPLRRWASWSFVMQAIGVAGMAAVFLVQVFNPDMTSIWQNFLTQTLGGSIRRAGMDAAQVKIAIDSVAPYFTGILATLIATGISLSLILGRYWQSVLYNPGGFAEEFTRWKASSAFSGLMLALSVAAIVLHQSLLMQMMLVGLVPFFFQSLGLAHALVKLYDMSTGWLVGLYVLLVFMTLQMAALLTAIGLVDGFVDIRSRLAKR